jgi:phosphoribosyl-ATP pyrophosphohydrolase
MTADYLNILQQLEELIQSRKGKDSSQSYTASLFSKGIPKITQKFGEEAIETVIAATAQGKNELISESADMIYHFLVLLSASNVSFEEVCNELKKRQGVSGINEKNNRM